MLGDTTIQARQKGNAAETQKSLMQFYKILKILQLQNDRVNADTTLGHKLSATRRLPESRLAAFRLSARSIIELFQSHDA